MYVDTGVLGSHLADLPRGEPIEWGQPGLNDVDTAHRRLMLIAHAMTNQLIAYETGDMSLDEITAFSMLSLTEVSASAPDVFR